MDGVYCDFIMCCGFSRVEYLWKGAFAPLSGTLFIINSLDNFHWESMVGDFNGKVTLYYPDKVSAILS